MWRAAAVLAVGLVAGCSSAPGAKLPPRSSPSPGPAATAAAVPSPTPVDHGPVPTGTPVFYAGDPVQQGWLVAFDWNGRPVGTLKLGAATAPASAAPEGDALFVGGTFYARSGRTLGTLPVTGKSAPVWSDDGSRVCDLRTVGDPAGTYRYLLWTAAVGGAERDVALVGPDTQAGQVGESLAACSVRRDLAVVVRTAIAWPTDVWFVRLSTGAILGHRSYAPQALTSVVASRDARYLAENAEQAPATLLRDVDSGTVIGSLGGRQVLAFSGDDSAALVAAGVRGSDLAVTDLRGAGSPAVSLPGAFLFAISSRGRPEFAVFVQQSSGADELYILRQDGPPIDVGAYRASVQG